MADTDSNYKDTTGHSRVSGSGGLKFLTVDAWSSVNCVGDNSVARVYHRGNCVYKDDRYYWSVEDNNGDEPGTGKWTVGKTLCQILSQSSTKTSPLGYMQMSSNLQRDIIESSVPNDMFLTEDVNVNSPVVNTQLATFAATRNCRIQVNLSKEVAINQLADSTFAIYSVAFIDQGGVITNNIHVKSRIRTKIYNIGRLHPDDTTNRDMVDARSSSVILELQQGETFTVKEATYVTGANTSGIIKIGIEIQELATTQVRD